MTDLWALSRGGAGLGRESKAAARSAKHECFRHFLLSEINEVLPAAMHWHDVLGIERFGFRHHVL
jgi:hypothetical protein